MEGEGMEGEGMVWKGMEEEGLEGEGLDNKHCIEYLTCWTLMVVLPRSPPVYVITYTSSRGVATFNMILQTQETKQEYYFYCKLIYRYDIFVEKLIFNRLKLHHPRTVFEFFPYWRTLTQRRTQAGSSIDSEAYRWDITDASLVAYLVPRLQ